MNLLLLAVIALLQISDGVTTYYGLVFTTKVAEANPIMACLIGGIGVGAAILVAKGVWFLALAPLVRNRERMAGRGWTVGLIGLTVWYSYVIFNNFLLVLR